MLIGVNVLDQNYFYSVSQFAWSLDAVKYIYLIIVIFNLDINTSWELNMNIMEKTSCQHSNSITRNYYQVVKVFDITDLFVSYILISCEQSIIPATIYPWHSIFTLIIIHGRNRCLISYLSNIDYHPWKEHVTTMISF